MFFGFDDDQLAFRDAARDLLDKECPPATVRAAATVPAGALDRDVWRRLGEMGVLHTLVAEAHGGLGLDEQSLVLVLEEAGRAALPHPLVDTAAVAAPLLAGWSSPGTPGAGIVATDLGGVNVACAADADRLLLHDPGDRALHLVDPASVDLTPVATVDRARRAATVDWTPAPGTLVTGDPADIDLARDRGAWGTAAVLVGLGQRMLDMTVAYVGERRQFGAPVGSFQAVKHHLADAHKDLAFARPAVHRAAHSLATGAATRARDVSMAKALASDAAWRAGRAALQCHGAIGYTVEHDLHLYLQRTWALAKAWGDAGWHRDRVARAIGV
ncbi:MAG TPA: acyl-CoA dehydrogenase family protein [Acidimicrobiales bacterium]|nr:acyl-CoA dehydrogenase family protein [Acidimicrobiales bacterium]